MEKNTKEQLVVLLDINYDDNETGVDTISFVKNPATLIEWHAFGEQEEKVSLKFNANSDERMVTAPIMIPNTLIRRYSEAVGEYFVKFSEETIKSMRKKYFKLNKSQNVNENHDSSLKLDNIFLVESFIIGDKVSSNLYPDLPDGTWMGTFHVEDEEYWNTKIITGEVKGFSLEGFFDMNVEEEAIEEIFTQVEDIVSSEASDSDKYESIKQLLNC